MATKILLKKSSTAGAVPLTTDLEIGEVALNLADRKLYSKNNSGNVVPIGAAYVATTAPTAPAEGDLWYDSTNYILKSFNGTAWSIVGISTLSGFGVTASATELNYTTGVTSSIQTQLDGKAASSHTHTAANVTDFNEAAQDAVGTIMSGTGIATVTYTDASNTIVVNATEVDTLASVTGRGATTATAVTLTNATASTTTGTGALVVSGGVGVAGNLNVGGNAVITGNLTVNGTTTTVNSNTVNIGDNVIILNSDETGTPSQNAGFEVERGTSANVSFVWNEANDAWDMGDYTLQNVRLDGGTY